MRLLTYEALTERGIPYSRMHLRRLERAGRFPQHIALTVRPDGHPGRIAWAEPEIDAWVEERSAARAA
ncbi:MAG: helix-turn-helix transcriptional regulator [Acetobacteraceae bacterium]